MLIPPPTLTADYDFEGIVALDDCSGSLIQLENSLDSDPAMVLTNGHCIETGFPTRDRLFTNQPSDRTFDLMEMRERTPSGRTVECRKSWSFIQR